MFADMFRFDQNFFVLAILIIVLYGLRILLFGRQINSMKSTIRECKEEGYAAIGIGQGSKYGWKAQALVCVNERGEIVRADVLSGITVFAHYKPFPKIHGYIAQDIANGVKELETVNGRIAQAIREACQQITRTQEKGGTNNHD